ncbi:MAG: hypothetical protein OXC60_05880 [Litoreibacter sp.]|nr:hypothetical protein [Litoreibacter sp.]
MLEQLKTKTTATARAIGHAIWSHRALYAGLAGAYVAACCGADKDLIQQIVAGCYVALVVKG